MGAHRAPAPNYGMRRVLAAVAAVVVVAGLVWFFFLRGDGGEPGDGDPTTPVALTCDDFRAQLVAEYKPLRKLQGQIIAALAPIDAGEDMTDEQIAEARAIVDEMSDHRRAIERMSKTTVPEPLQQDMFGLVPTLNEFFSLADRTVEWLEGIEPAKPTETPSVQLQALYDFLTPPAKISKCV